MCCNAALSDVHFVLFRVRLAYSVETCYTHLSKSAGFVRTDDADRPEGLDSLQRLAKNFVFAHEVSCDSQRCGQRNRKSFGDESNCN